MSKKFTTEQFIEKATAKFNGRYKYPYVVYEGAHKKVKIVCVTHGIFEQTPNSHLSGHGCKRCADEDLILTNEEFIERAAEYFKNKYYYPESYINANTKITIICPIHGPFKQTPANHLWGYGCKACGGNEKLTTKIFKENAEAEHGFNSYDWSKVVYKGAFIEVEIVCFKHGSFWIKPNNHVSGKQGCPKCNSSLSKAEESWINSFNNPNIIRQHKIFLTDKKIAITDGFDPTTNTVYEYNGKFWHGHPDIFPDRNALHPVCKSSVNDLYNETIRRETILKEMGYNIISIWGD